VGHRPTPWETEMGVRGCARASSIRRRRLACHAFIPLRSTIAGSAGCTPPQDQSQQEARE
ncbi:MAG: hypothetical protein ACRDGA_07015, partial [Bacteroidota bacterium]